LKAFSEKKRAPFFPEIIQNKFQKCLMEKPVLEQQFFHIGVHGILNHKIP
jgi:hypothetical protein